MPFPGLMCIEIHLLRWSRWNYLSGGFLPKVVKIRKTEPFTLMQVHRSLPPLHHLPKSFPLDGAVRIELESGVPIFRASANVQARIVMLLEKQQLEALTESEEQELDAYEEIDDYLSFVNRTIRNLAVVIP
ncbi:MAG: hypothetical protein HLUCCO16_17815 [Phormidium sp. OSCR]|nr:MAG: hypothetical protein HLUCCO16_17815 [Phormidium sp. OSCR]